MLLAEDVGGGGRKHDVHGVTSCQRCAVRCPAALSATIRHTPPYTHAFCPAAHPVPPRSPFAATGPSPACWQTAPRAGSGPERGGGNGAGSMGKAGGKTPQTSRPAGTMVIRAAAHARQTRHLPAMRGAALSVGPPPPPRAMLPLPTSASASPGAVSAFCCRMRYSRSILARSPLQPQARQARRHGARVPHADRDTATALLALSHTAPA